MTTFDWHRWGPLASERGQGALAPVIAGRVASLHASADGQDLVAANAGGLMRSRDGGQSWHSITATLAPPPLPAAITFDHEDDAPLLSWLRVGAVARPAGFLEHIYLGSGDYVGAKRATVGYGIAHSSDGGTSWAWEEVGAGSPSLVGAAIHAIVAAPDRPEVALAATSRGLYRRIEQGGSHVWQRVAVHAPLPGHPEQDGESQEIAALTTQQDGATWRVFLAQRHSGVYVSNDSGETWQVLGANLKALIAAVPTSLARHMALACRPSADPFLYLLQEDGHLFLLDQSAATPSWNYVRGMPSTAQRANFRTTERERHLALFADPADPHKLWLGGSRVQTRDVSGGDSEWSAALYRATIQLRRGQWSIVADSVGRGVPPYVNAILGVAPHGSVATAGLYVASDSGLFFAEDRNHAGNIFAARNFGLGGIVVSAYASHPEVEVFGYAATKNNGALLSNGSSFWRSACNLDRSYDHRVGLHLGETHGIVLDASAPQRFALVDGAGMVLMAQDAGVAADPSRCIRWQIPQSGGDKVGVRVPLATGPQAGPDASPQFLVTASRKLWIHPTFADPVGAWQSIGPLQTHPIIAVAVASASLIFAGTEHGEVYRYEKDGGGSWSVQSLHAHPGLLPALTATHPRVQSILLTGPDSILVAFAGRNDHPKLWQWQAATWSEKSGDVAHRVGESNVVQVFALAKTSTPDRLWAATERGVFVSEDTGTTWQPSAETHAQLPALAFSIHPSGLLRTSLDGHGLLETKLDLPDDQRDPEVSLVIREHLLDARWRTTALVGSPDPYDPNPSPPSRRTIAAMSSPDIKVDSADASGNYQIDVSVEPTEQAFLQALVDESHAVVAANSDADTHVYVRIHNRGKKWAHATTVALLVGKDDAVSDQLPPHYWDLLRRGLEVSGETWRTADRLLVDSIPAQGCKVVRLRLSPDIYLKLAADPPATQWRLVVLIDHPLDRWTSEGNALTAVLASERKAAAHKIQTDHPAAGVAVVAPTIARYWRPLGPIAMRRGQAATRPVVSGRVTDIALSASGNRMYVATVNGGVWRSDDGGMHWHSNAQDNNPTRVPGLRSFDRVDTLCTGAVAIDLGFGARAENPDWIFAASGERDSPWRGVGVFHSNDGGDHWVLEPSTPSLRGTGAYRVVIDPRDPQRAVAAMSNGLYRRELIAGPGSGYQWKRQVAGEHTSVAVAARGGATSFFAAQRVDATGTIAPSGITAAKLQAAIYESNDGAAWVALPALAGTTNWSGRMTIAVQRNNPDLVYVFSGADRTIRRCVRIAGVWGAWTTLSGLPSKFPDGQLNYNLALCVSPTDQNLLLAGGSTRDIGGQWSGEIFRLKVAGNNIISSDLIGGGVHADIHHLTFRPGQGREAWVGCDGGLFVAPRADEATGIHVFTARNNGRPTLLLNSLAIHPTLSQVMYSGTQDNGGMRYVGEEVWQLAAFGDGGDAVFRLDDHNRVRMLYHDRQIANIVGAGEGGVDVNVPKLANDDQLFYAPLVGGNSPAHPQRLLYGSRALWLSESFGDGLAPVEVSPGTVLNNGLICAICAASDTTIYVATQASGALPGSEVLIYRFAAGSWTATAVQGAASAGADPSYPTSTAVHVTAIVADPTSPTTKFYVALGGNAGTNRVWYFDGTNWHLRSGTLTPLPNTHASTLFVDPVTPANLYLGTDIGVFYSPDGGRTTWNSVQTGLPDAAISRLAYEPNLRLLRAATFGRGVWELPLDQANLQQVELYLRKVRSDPAREGVAPPYGGPDLGASSGKVMAFGDGSDIKVDVPTSAGSYQYTNNEVVDVVAYFDQLEDRGEHVPVSTVDVVSRVYVLAHNRGSTVPSADDPAELVLLLGSNVAQPLPANWREAVLGNRPLVDDNWRLIGRKAVVDVGGESPRCIRFDLRSAEICRPNQLGEKGNTWALVAILFHRRKDPLLVSGTDIAALCQTHRQITYKKIRVVPFESNAPSLDRGVRPYVAGLRETVALTVAAKKLDAIAQAMAVKLATHPENITDADRYLAQTSNRLVTWLQADGGPQGVTHVDLARVSPYAIFGARLAEIIDYVDILAPHAGGVASLLRRGSPDEHLSRVQVAGFDFAYEFATRALQSASAADHSKVRAIALGMQISAASRTVLAPLRAGISAQLGEGDYDEGRLTAYDVYENRLLGTVHLGDEPYQSHWLQSYPERDRVPAAVWQTVAQLVGERIDTYARYPEIFANNDVRAQALVKPSAEDLGDGYDLYRRTLTPASMGQWFGLLTPLFLAPSIAWLITALAGSNAKKLYFAQDDGGTESDESGYHQLMAGVYLGSSLMPFIYSMILWPMLPRQNCYFGQSLAFGLARFILPSISLALPKESDGGRWGTLAPTWGTDAYSLVQAIVNAAQGHPGHARLWGLQTLPLGFTLLFMLLSLLIDRAKWKEGWQFWVIWSVVTLLIWLAIGLPVASAIADSGGLVGLLRNRESIGDLARRLAAYDEEKLRTLGPTRARAFAADLLWDPSDAQLTYPSGRRPALIVWWEGDGDIELQIQTAGLAIRQNAVVTQVDLSAVDGPAAAITAIEAALAGLRAAMPRQDYPAEPWHQPWLFEVSQILPSSGDAANRPATFEKVGKSQKNGLTIFHLSRAYLAAPVGFPAAAGEQAHGLALIADTTANVDASAMGWASDLASLLATSMVAQMDSTDASPMPVPGAAAPLPAARILRQWNLSERQVSEWQALFAVPSPTQAAAPMADKMGILPLWRTFTAAAQDPARNMGAGGTFAGTPSVRANGEPPFVPTTADVVAGMRELLSWP